MPLFVAVAFDKASGSAELRRDYLAPAIAGTAVASIAVTEPDTGSDVARLRTRARATVDAVGAPAASRAWGPPTGR